MNSAPRMIILSVLVVAAACTNDESQTAPAADLLDLLAARATSGAAAGYVADSVCANCHLKQAQSYQAVGMSQSFGRPYSRKEIEDFGAEFYHEPSDRFFEIRKNDGRLTFRRYQRDKNDDIVNEFSVPIDWVIGSGNRVRSYLYQTEWGEIFMLPVSWYSESQEWQMSPGFEESTHQGVHRKIQRECLFCHNAYPEVSTGSDAYWQSEVFPHKLPEGTGCQRCHGPGATHIREVLSGEGDYQAIRAAIVNPGKLQGEQLNSVCFQCHMLPSVSVLGARRIGRGDYSFRPGEILSDYLVHVVVTEQGIEREDQFEINHHGYRFFQSRCYQESEGALACTTCHDPHVKPQSENFRKEVATVCQSCHTEAQLLHQAIAEFNHEDCAGCHMPTRRTSDVIHSTMTDHRIAAGPFDFDALVDPVEKIVRPVTDVSLLDFGNPPDGEAGTLYRFMALARANRFVDSARLGIEQHLQRNHYSNPTPYIDLARTQLQVGKYSDAEATLRRLLRSYNTLPVAHTLLGTALMAQGQTAEAIEQLLISVNHQPDPEVFFNLGLGYMRSGEIERAEAALDNAIQLRPFMAAAWKYKGIILQSRQRIDAAIDAFVRSLELEPLDSAVYAELIALLRATNNYDEADRYLELGLRVSHNPSTLESLR